MHIKAKLYPYPVLAIFNNDYVNSQFNIEAKTHYSANEIVVSLNPILINDGILKLVEQDKAFFAAHIECPLTSFRVMVEVPASGIEYHISSDRLCGAVSICPFVIAKETIKNYTNTQLNKDYDGVSFEIEKGNIMAIGKELPIVVEKESDDLANIPSIFAVTEIKDETKTDIIIDITGNKINIQLPKNIYTKFKFAQTNPSATTVIHAMIIIPALMKCFDNMKSKPDELYIYENRRWYRALKKALKKLNMELSEETILSIDSFEASQKIMNNTTARAILAIDDIAFKGGVDDD